MKGERGNRVRRRGKEEDRGKPAEKGRDAEGEGRRYCKCVA
jgi:hypothetical protein